MNFNVRLTTINDYPELVTWWKWHRWSNPPSIELLDNLKFGIMICQGSTNICAGFLYFTNARAFGLLEYVISNHKVKDKTIRKEALKLLIASLIEVANKKGMHTIVTFVKHPNLINTLNDCGFVKSADNYSSMVFTHNS